MQSLISRWKVHEARFSSNNYDGEKDALLHIRHGQFPVLLLAPHAVNHYRPDGTLKPADLATGGLVWACAERVDISAAINTCRHPSMSPHTGTPPVEEHAHTVYPQAKATLDIHGMRDNPDFAFALGTSGPITPAQQRLIDLCTLHLSPAGPVALNPATYTAEPPQTLTHRLKHSFKTPENAPPILQLEIARRLRVPMGETPESRLFLEAFYALLLACTAL